VTGEVSSSGTERTSRVIPAVVVSLFTLVAVADLVVIVLYGNYRNVIEKNGVEVVFVPDPHPSSDADDPGGPAESGQAEIVLSGNGHQAAADGALIVERTDDTVVMRAPGVLTMSFRAPDAGHFVEMTYEFLDPGRQARCEVKVARVASRYGVDVVRRRTLKGFRRPRGTFRHNLADHAGWFELSVRVNPAAAEGGVAIGLPTIVEDFR
jgi:hypothetical protein